MPKDNSPTVFFFGIILGFLIIFPSLHFFRKEKVSKQDKPIWFCRIIVNKNQSTAAAWASTTEPRINRGIFEARDDDNNKIYEIERDTKAPNDSKSLDRRVLPREKILEMYEKYKDVWVGNPPERSEKIPTHDPWKK